MMKPPEWAHNNRSPPTAGDGTGTPKGYRLTGSVTTGKRSGKQESSKSGKQEKWDVEKRFPV